MKSITLNTTDAPAPADFSVGDRVELIRGDGPREGALLCYARITGTDPVLDFDVEWAEAPSHVG